MKSCNLKIGLLSIFLLCRPNTHLLHAQSGHWSDPVDISNTPGVSLKPDMAIGSDNRVHVVWEDGSRLENLWMVDVLYAVCDGITWSVPVQISSLDTTYSMYPRIAVDSYGTPHVVWKHHAILPTTAIYYSKLTESGWTEPYNLTEGLGPTSPADIGVDGNDNVHVVMAAYNNASGHFDLFHRQYDGFEWLPIDTLNSPVDAGTPCLAIDSQNNLHLAWMGDPYPITKIYYSKYNGLYLSPVQNVSQMDSLPSIEPSIALDTIGNPHIVWNQLLPYLIEEVFYAYFDGVNWLNPQNLTNLGLREANYPVIAISSQDIKCVIFSSSSQNGDPYPNYLLGYGSHWTGADTMLCEDYRCGTLSLVVDDNDTFHSCLSTGFNYVSNIGYTRFEYFNAVQPTIQINSTQFSGFECHPNPCNIEAFINFVIPSNSEIVVDVYNINGQLINSIKRGFSQAGEYEIIWKGANKSGKEVSAGMYLLRVQVNGETYTKKLMLIK